MYFMSTMCGRPQGGGGLRPMWTHVATSYYASSSYYACSHTVRSYQFELLIKIATIITLPIDPNQGSSI